MTHDQTRLILSLFFTKGVSAAFIRRLLDKWQQQQVDYLPDTRDIAALSSTESELQAASRALRPDKELNLLLEQTLQWCREPCNHVIFASDSSYPALLREIPDYPPLLFVRGNAEILRRPMVAIVGSRSCSAYGRSVAYRLAAELTDKGLIICSGLASGIDTQAHLAALDSNGATVAVLGNGLSSVYPVSNKSLAERIVNIGVPESGALVSELPLDAGPLAEHFPQRNRIISGLSLGVCVVEANMRSGSLITARLALEQNREIFSVPGSINSPGSRGCHKLLRQGAVLTENAQDILEHIEFICQAQLAMCYPEYTRNKNQIAHTRPGTLPTGLELPADCELLYRELCQDGVSIETLILRTGLEFSELSEKLLRLEVCGLASHNGSRWQRLEQNE
jgi:DNA processing protein